MWFLGMDVGTGGTRAAVVDAAGKLIAGALRAAFAAVEL
jgi:xylulokinase